MATTARVLFLDVVSSKQVRPIVFTSTPLREALIKHLAPYDVETVTSISELEEAARDPNRVAFIDGAALEAAGDGLPFGASVVAICDGPLQSSIGWLSTHAWLSHVISAATLQQAMAKPQLANLMASFEEGSKPRLLDRIRDSMSGRRVALTQASRRADRIEKMSEYFDSNGIGARTVQLLRDAAEELLTNAFYDAPVAAGAVEKPISRTLDVSLPAANPCDMSYGCSDDFAIVRVRDPFGALSRTRMVEVLTRCARTDMRVDVDESMGGAGLGLWRIFTVASFVAISVVRSHHTDILVGIGKQRTTGGQRPYAFHLFFRDSEKPRHWELTSETAVERTFATSRESS